MRTGVDNALRETMATINLPSLFIATIVNVAAVTASRRPALVARVPLISSVVGVASIPVSTLLSGYVSDAVMNWAIRPLLNNYVDPRPAEASVGAEAAISDSLRSEDMLPDSVDLDQVLGMDLSPLDRARLAWAMDGKEDTPFPEGPAQLTPPSPAGRGIASAGGTSQELR